MSTSPSAKASSSSASATTPTTATPLSKINYLKAYPYLFVRETDQVEYFCTLCDTYLEEEHLQSHLFEGHQAENCEDLFVRVCSGETNKGYFVQKNFLYICVVCWAKLPHARDTVEHRRSCKANPPESALENGAVPIGHKPVLDLTNNNNESKSPSPVTKVVSTPDISNLLSRGSPSAAMNGMMLHHNGGGVVGNASANTSRADSPYSESSDHLVIDLPDQQPTTAPAPPSLKRSRKKATPFQHLPAGLPPAAALTQQQQQQLAAQLSSMQQQALAAQILQCSLCSFPVPAPGFLIHLRDFHRVTTNLSDTSCPLCQGPVPVTDMTLHLATVHAITPQSAVNAILLWVLTSNTADNNNKANVKSANNKLGSMLNGSGLSGMNGGPAANLLQSHPQHPVIELDMPKPSPSPAFGNGQLPMGLPPLMKGLQHPFMFPNGGSPLGLPTSQPQQIPTVLQTLLNNPDLQQQHQQPPPVPTAAAPPTNNNTGSSNSSMGLAVENIVSKFIRVHVSHTGKESIQCLVCAKWFAVPPVKHLRGHMVTFKDEKKRVVSLINGSTVRIIC